MDDLPIKLIIGAIVLVFWVLNQLFGQENKPVPNPAKGQPLGPRPPGRMPPAPRPAAAPVPRDPTMRWPSPESSPRPVTSRPAQRPARTKTGAAAKAKPAELAKPQTLLGGVEPKAAPITAAPPVAKPVTTSAPPLAGLLLAARSPAQLREAVLLNEVLQPPLALRPRRRP